MVADASAYRRVRSIRVLGDRLLGTSVWAVAGAGGAGSRDGADRQAGAIISWRAGGRRLPAVDGGHRCCCRSAAKERRPSRRVGRATLAAVATVRTRRVAVVKHVDIASVLTRLLVSVSYGHR